MPTLLSEKQRDLEALLERKFPRGTEHLDLGALEQGLASLEVTSEWLDRHVVFSESSYSRVLIHDRPSYQVLLLCWSPGQMSPIHNHSGSRCVVRVLRGDATEVAFHENERGLFAPSEAKLFSCGQVTASEDSDTHQMGNTSVTPLVTLHLYSPPLLSMEVFGAERCDLSAYPAILGGCRN